MATEEIYIKAGIDTSSFDSSIKGMQNEIRKLKGLVGSSLISPEEQRTVLSRMATLKANIRDIDESISKVKGFELLARSVGGLSAGIGAVTGSLKLLGVEFGAANKAEEIMMTTMNSALGIQQLLELANLKTAISTKAVAAAQWLWNNALKANPAVAVAAAVTTLIGVVYGLIKAFEKSEEVTRDYISEQTELKKRIGETDKALFELGKTQDQLTIINATSNVVWARQLRSLAEVELQTKKNALAINELGMAEDLRAGKRVDAYVNEREQLLKQINNIQATINLYKDYEGKQLKLAEDATKRSSKKKEEQQKDKNSKIIDNELKTQEELYKLRLEYGLVSIQEQFQKELDEVVKTEAYKTATVEQQEAIKLGVRKKYQKLWEDSLKEGEITKLEPKKSSLVSEPKAPEKMEKVNNELETTLETTKSILGEIQSLTQSIFPQLEGSVVQFAEVFNNEMATVEEKMLATLQLISAVSSEIFNQIYASNQATFEKGMNDLNKTFEYEYKSLDKLLKNKQISDAEYNKRKEKLDADREKKELELKKEKAKKDKEAAIIQAIIGTALGVIYATQTAPPLNIILPILIGALGAAQIALIASQPLAYAKGGLVKKYATGGLLDGPSHSQGGIPIFAEGGEFIVNKNTMAKPGMVNFMNNVNSNRVEPSTTISVINRDDLRTIVQEVISIPVNVVETDITSTQRKVSSIETSASW